MKKISAVYKVTNTISGEFYVGSSKDVKKRWNAHKCPSVWNRYPNNRMYRDMQTYGIEAFTFEVLAEFPQELLRIKEQETIETLHPTYNSIDAYITDEEQKAYKKAIDKAYREAHKEERNAKAKAYHEAHKEEKKAKNKAYREAHKEEIKAINKAYYETHREKIKAYKKAYRETNKKRIMIDEHLEPNKDTTQ